MNTKHVNEAAVANSKLEDLTENCWITPMLVSWIGVPTIANAYGHEGVMIFFACFGWAVFGLGYNILRLIIVRIHLMITIKKAEKLDAAQDEIDAYNNFIKGCRK